MFWKIPGLTLLTAALVLLSACEKKDPAPPAGAPAFPGQIATGPLGNRTPGALLQALHHAAQEMALDGFQFDQAELGWPFDCRASNSTAYLRLLVEKGYLAAQDLDFFRDIEIANLSDSDPGETAFAKIQLRNKSHFIQKDGTLLSASDATQPPHFPSRDPAWLPK